MTPDLDVDAPAASAALVPTPGAVTVVGSWPGIDPHETARVVVGECPALPALPELPARGAGADMVGRTAALLDGISAEVVPSGWRLTARPGPDDRRANAWYRQDLDAFEEAAHGTTAPVKLQLTGPLTLAASLELRSGERALSDHGARADLLASLTETAGEQVRELRRRLPSASTVVVQFDEPSIAAVLGGRVPTASGYRTYRSVPRQEALDALRTLVAAVRAVDGVAAIHTCASDVPYDLLVASGADALSFDVSGVPTSAYDVVAGAVDSGVVLLAGVVPTDGRSLSDLRSNVDALQRWWSRLGFAPDLLAQRSVITPACGLAGLAPASARAVLARCHDIARAVLEDPDGDHRADR